ncbi:MAG: GNAT family N-acetyltransferase [Clostridiales bacterium]|jgi:GNAT superfamily N-acetyltransferase|nr:GNAT family N-acetyltransferase [Clostridiales bacterium]
MRLSHPIAPYQGIPPEDVFFVANDQHIQLGLGFAVLSMQQEMYPEKPLQIYIYIDAQPSARDILLGALLARADQMRAAYPHLKGRIYTELAPTQWELLNFYNRSGFANQDAEEEHVFPLPQEPAQVPMSCQFASVPLQTPQEQAAFLARMNSCRMTPIAHDYLVLQMQQPYFMALGYYRGGQPVAEQMISGTEPDNIALIMMYVRAEYRQRGIAKSLISSCANLLRERGVKQMAARVYTRNQPQTALIRSLGGVRRRVVTMLPSIEI